MHVRVLMCIHITLWMCRGVHLLVHKYVWRPEEDTGCPVILFLSFIIAFIKKSLEYSFNFMKQELGVFFVVVVRGFAMQVDHNV